MENQKDTASSQLFSMISAFWVSQLVYVAAKLGIADFLSDGLKSSAELARLSGTHERSLYRVLRALASVGVFTESSPRQFALTPLASLLRSDVPGSMRHLALFYGEECYRAWRHLLYSVKTGGTAFDHVFKAGLFEYLSENPERGDDFNRAMTPRSILIAAAVVEAYDFSNFAKVVDVGGGHGTMISAILKANPELTGVLFDMPLVIEGAKREIGAAGLDGRCELITGDFFTSVPAGGDAYILSRIIHDWDDERSIRILKNCRAAMAGDGKLLVVEEVIPPGDKPSLGKFVDIQMLVITGGQERTEREFRTLLAAAGFQLTRTITTNSGMDVVEALPG